MAALEAGRILMESGARSSSVETLAERFARALGADRVDLRIGYASLAITIGVGDNGITRMREVGHLGVNQRVDAEVRRLADRLEAAPMSVDEVRAELERILATTRRHASAVTALAVGVACAAFGRLLHVDWEGIVPVFVAATVGQFARRELLARHANGFVTASIVAFLAALLGAYGARATGSETITTAMIASILLLIPGIPSVNAQSDILEGHPTIGSARAVTVAVTLVFIAAGLWLAQVLTGAVSQVVPAADLSRPWVLLVEQTVCGAIAAAGFGVLFNISFRSLPWCALSGAVALLVRSYCQGLGWNLEASSFAAALVVSTFVLVLRAQTDISQNALDVVGCIPMVPGSFAAKAILGLFALSSIDSLHATETLVTAVQYTVRVMFTIGAIGTGLAIPALMMRVRVVD